MEISAIRTPWCGPDAMLAARSLLVALFVNHCCARVVSPRASVALSSAASTPAVAAVTGNAATCLAFFDAWNQRDMTTAVGLFSEDVQYEDTVYPDIFDGRNQLRAHLLRVADALPESFQFVVDDFSSGPEDAEAIGVKWHVESNGNQLPFTRGCSFYKFNAAGEICSGFDLVEPSLKPGDATLALLSLASKVLKLLGK